MDNLYEELIIYEDLTKERELLNIELHSLSGKNDSESLARISEVEKLLNENNTKISRLRKEEGFTRKEAMEEVYGDEKDKHIDYKIVNRVTNFKENTCQRINTGVGKVVNTTKTVTSTIAKPFRWIRDNYHNDVKRAELQSKIDEAKAISIKLNETKKKVKVNPNIGGYVGTIALTVMGVLVLAGIIFITIGNIINK